MVLLVGGFVGWKSALYSVREQLTEPVDLPPIEAERQKPLNLDLFWEVQESLDQDYVDELSLDKEAQLYGAIKGLVESVDDPYTVFMTPDETNQFQNSLDDTLQGVGIELTMREGNLTVIAPIKNSPAEAAGIVSGDIVATIDDEFVLDMTLFEAIMKIRGEEGTVVNLGIIRENEEELLDFEITRAQIDLPSVELAYLGEEEQIAHITINKFASDTKTEFSEYVQDILLKEVDGVVLDMRYNGGGFLEIAVDILSDFVEGKEKAVIIKHRDPEQNEIRYTNESGLLADVPLVVLVNEGSASASEIIAGAVQDHERGILIGEQTFGKGSVQVIDRLEDGSSLRFTIAKWYTPDDRTIDEVGIFPDMLVQIDDTRTEETENDSQLRAAIDYLEGL